MDVTLSAFRIARVDSGDNKATAEAVGRQVGILDHHEGPVVHFGSAPGGDAERLASLTAAEFDALPPAGQALAARHLRVFSRVEPKHKRDLVQLLKAQNEVRLAGGFSRP